MNRMKTLRLALVIGMVVAATAALAAEPRPMAVINSERIAQEYPAMRDAQEQYQKFVQDLERELSLKEKALSAAIEELDSQQLLLGKDALATKTQQLEKQKAEYFQFREAAEQKAEAEGRARMQPILDQVKTIVERLAKERGLGMVVDSAAMTVLYVDPQLEITNDVLQALVRGDK